jgi:tetratricopeptide (TPR) repeat protein
MRLFIPFLFFSYHFTTAQTDRSLLYEKAVEFGYRHQFKEAEIILSQIITINPLDSMAYFDRAIMRENMGDTIGALDDFTKEISIDAKQVDSYFLRGMLYLKTKQYELALTDFKKVNQLDYGNADAHFFAALLMEELGKPSRSIRKQLRNCLNINPAHEEARAMLKSYMK